MPAEQKKAKEPQMPKEPKEPRGTRVPKEPEVAVVEDGVLFILQPGTHVFVKTADICAMTGKSNQWIGQLTSQGVLNRVKTKHGALYDLRDTVNAYCSNLSYKKQGKGNGLDSEKLVVETEIKRSKAIVAALEASELLGEMHRSEDVAAMTEELIFAVRGALISLPGRLAIDVSKAETPAEVSDIIRAEVFKIMEELSLYKYEPKRFEERVRERKRWSAKENQDEDSA